MKVNDYRIGNYMNDRNGRLCRVEEINKNKEFRAPAIVGGLTSLPNSNIILTKEVAKKFGFEIVDMGDFWEFNLGDFQLIQLKSHMLPVEPVPFYVLHSKKSRHIKVPFAHKLQNLYYAIEGKELVFNN